MSKMNVEAFLKKWESADNLEYRAELREWMQNSYTDPQLFWSDLFSCLEKRETPSNTVVFERYDFYADCILRHLGQGLIALKLIDPEGAAQAWSYDEIHAYVEAQLPHWTEHYGIKPGKTVALLLPFGIHFLVGLMTALRLGLVVSILPLQDRYMGNGQLGKAVALLAPDLIVTERAPEAASRKNVLELDLTLEMTTSPSDESHAYLAAEPVQKHFNPHGTKEESLTVIEATRSYLLPLRDAVISLNLKHSSCWARPFLSLYREEPCCTLMALLTGATLLHIADDHLRTHPKALENETVHILGVSLPLLQLWLKTPGCPASKLKLWYRSPLFGNDHSWRAFSELNHLTKVPAGQLLIDKEKGGITLFSQPKSEGTLTFMHPSLGSPWKLLKIDGKNALSTEGFGLFSVEPANKAERPLVLAQIGDEWSITTTLLPLREGYCYPAQLIEEKVKTLDFVQTCMAVPERHPQHFLSKQWMLLVFISPKEHHFVQQKTEEWTREINALIKSEAGEAFIPDQSLFFSMYPQQQKGEIDRASVENQYRSGTLFYKQNHPIYRLLNLLKQHVYENLAYKTVRQI